MPRFEVSIAFTSSTYAEIIVEAEDQDAAEQTIRDAIDNGETFDGIANWRDGGDTEDWRVCEDSTLETDEPANYPTDQETNRP